MGRSHGVAGTGAASLRDVPETRQLKDSGMGGAGEVSRGRVRFRPFGGGLEIRTRANVVLR